MLNLTKSKMLEAYCAYNSKEDIIKDFDIESLSPAARKKMFMSMVSKMSNEAFINILMGMEKDDIVDVIKEFFDVVPNIKTYTPRPALKKVFVDPADLKLVMPKKGVPDWFKKTIMQKENGEFSAKWSSRFGLMRNALYDEGRAYVYPEVVDAFNEAVKMAK